ncbi:hypothetical protein DPMN_049226 [Dreissena polymorpha]|uniref:NACHT domain-containing protein n=1 Tax=Dreissena polymorpha TaxID=45954 RepID=A0A9D4CE07_DREPO|nr:hypothetical protein DPMN_049226 [Dreissena polymorpha]
MTQQESDRAIDTLVALLQSLKNADHQGASKSAVDKITQVDLRKKNTGKSITAEIIKAGEEQIAIIKRTHEDNSCIKSKRARKGLDSDQDLGRTGNDIASIESPFARDSPLFKIKAWLIEQYQSKCVAPVSMLDPDIDVPLERIYVPPSIKELKRGQEDRCGGIETDNTSRGENDVSCYKELLHRDGNQNNTMYIQGDPGCGKTTFSTKLVLDWCNAHSENGASTKKKRKVTTRGKASNRTGFSDLDTLRDYKFLFFVSLRDYSGTMCNVSQMVEEAIQSNKLPWDDSVWEDKCIVLTDAADEWHHPDPSKSNSACKCKDRRIITKKKSLALSQQKNIPYMFVHKTIQEFLASMHIAINQTDIEDILKDIQRVYCDGESILDIGQLFIFTCGMCVPVAERMSKHMMDVITSDMKSKLLSISDQEMDLFSTPYLAQRILLGGFIESSSNPD